MRELEESWFEEKDEQDTILQVQLGEIFYPFCEGVRPSTTKSDNSLVTSSDAIAYSSSFIIPELNATGIVTLVHDVKSLAVSSPLGVGEKQAVVVPALAIPTVTMTDLRDVEEGLTCLLERYGEMFYANSIPQISSGHEFKFDKWSNIVTGKDNPPRFSQVNDLLQTGLTFYKTSDLLLEDE